MPNGNASVLAQTQMNINGTGIGGGVWGQTHYWTWGLLIILLLIIILHYLGSGGLRGSVAS